MAYLHSPCTRFLIKYTLYSWNKEKLNSARANKTTSNPTSIPGEIISHNPKARQHTSNARNIISLADNLSLLFMKMPKADTCAGTKNATPTIRTRRCIALSFITISNMPISTVAKLRKTLFNFISINISGSDTAARSRFINIIQSTIKSLPYRRDSIRCRTINLPPGFPLPEALPLS